MNGVAPRRVVGWEALALVDLDSARADNASAEAEDKVGTEVDFVAEEADTTLELDLEALDLVEGVLVEEVGAQELVAEGTVNEQVAGEMMVLQLRQVVAVEQLVKTLACPGALWTLKAG